MALTVFDITEIIESMENYLEKVRPEEAIRDQLDIGYKITGQSVEIFEIRPRPDNSSLKQYPSIAKTTFIKSKGHWKLFWMRADLKWHGYKPNLYLKNLKKVVEIIDKDEFGCFYG